MNSLLHLRKSCNRQSYLNSLKEKECSFIIIIIIVSVLRFTRQLSFQYVFTYAFTVVSYSSVVNYNSLKNYNHQYDIPYAFALTLYCCCCSNHNLSIQAFRSLLKILFVDAAVTHLISSQSNVHRSFDATSSGHISSHH